MVGCANGVEEEQEVVDSVVHVHDMAFDREEAELLYVGTHHGLLQINLNNGMKWQGPVEERHDFMGFTITSENKFVSSGHPDPKSSFENPLGLLVSEDKGETWSMDKLYGEVDFHLIDVNEGDSSVIYGFDAFGERVMRSNNGGEAWETASSNGIDDRLRNLYSMVSNPENSEEIMVALPDGIYTSTDRGDNFELENSQLTMTNVDISNGSLYAFGLGDIEGLMKSEDFGESWDKIADFPSDEPVISLAVEGESNIIAIGTAADSIFWSDDQAETWHPIVEDGMPVI